MKKLTFKGMLDNLRSSVAGVADAVTGANKFDTDPDENMKPTDFAFTEVSRHGFPQDPSAIAFEPIQRILAIGTRHGTIRLLGRPGVDYFLKQASGTSDASDRESLFGSSSAPSSSTAPSSAILQICFLVGEGSFIALTGNSWLHLWNYKSRRPEVLQSLEFTKEALTVCHVPYQSKWMYAGTDKGNVHVVQVETFALSGYVINWNKAMDVFSRNHPGKVMHLSDCPTDSSKLLIGFDSGLITLWDLKGKQAEARFQAPDTLCHLAWHFDGKQFVSSHADATLAVWNVKGAQVDNKNRPASLTAPHPRRSKEDPAVPIAQVDWRRHKSGSEPLLLFSGGVTFDQKASRGLRSQIMTIIHGKSTTVLEMEHPIVSFLCIPSQPWNPETSDNEAVVVLLENDLVAVDLSSPGYPLFENPYPMDLHEPALLHCYYVSDCPSDLIPTLYTSGSKSKKTNFTDKEWPIDGGQWGIGAAGYTDFLLTTHTEGTLRFWDISSASLQHLDKVKVSKIFERPKKSQTSVAAADGSASVQKNADGQPAPIRSSASFPDGAFDVQMVVMDDECRYLAVACVGGFVILYQWNKQETSSDIAVIDMTLPEDGPTEENGKTKRRKAKVKSGQLKRAPGFQPMLVGFVIESSRDSVVNTDDNGTSDSMITSLAISSKHGLLAVGTDRGLSVADILQKQCILRLLTPDIYGEADPFNRGCKTSPREKTPQPSGQHDQPSADTHQAVSTPPPSNGSPKQQAAPASSAGASPSKTKLGRARLMREQTVGGGKHASCPSSSSMPSQPNPPSCASSSTASSSSPTNSSRMSRSHVLQRMRSLAYSLECDTHSQLHQQTNQLPKDRAIHASLEKSEMSRSKSSSSDDLDVIQTEAVISLKFADTYGKRADLVISPCLFVGTELGSVLIVTFQMPILSDVNQTTQSQRMAQPVIGVPSGSLLRANSGGAAIAIELLDARGAILNDSSAPASPPVVVSKDKEESRNSNPRTSDSSAGQNPQQNFISLLGDPRHVLVVCFERQLRTFILPNQGTYQKMKLQQESSSNNGVTILKCSIQKYKDNTCAFCYFSTGRVNVYSLPTLKPLLEVALSSPNDLRVARTVSFSQHGNAVFMSSRAEIQKVSFSAETSASVPDWLGTLYVCREAAANEPCPANTGVVSSGVGFLKGLIGSSNAPSVSTAQQLEQDRNELFGESAGRASKAVARHVAGTMAMDHARSTSSTAGSEIARAKLAAMERGEKLSQLEEITERMREQAGAFSSNANQLANKYKDKKWYQI